MADTFRVALSGDFRKADGSPTFPDFDLAPLRGHPGIEVAYLEPGPEIKAGQVADFDALILLTPRFGDSGVNPNGRLVPTVEQGVELNQGGFDFICYSGDVWVLHNALAAAIGELRAKCRRN